LHLIIVFKSQQLSFKLLIMLLHSLIIYSATLLQILSNYYFCLLLDSVFLYLSLIPLLFSFYGLDLSLVPFLFGLFYQNLSLHCF